MRGLAGLAPSREYFSQAVRFNTCLGHLESCWARPNVTAKFLSVLKQHVMRVLITSVVALAACQDVTPPVGPTLIELVAAMRASPDVSGAADQRQAVRHLRCISMSQEPTAFSCDVETRSDAGWTKRSAVLAVSHGEWILLRLD